MNDQGIKQAVERYRRKFTELQVEPVRFPGCQSPRTPQERLAHCFAILPDIVASLDKGEREKAKELLCFVRGCLWSDCIFTMDELLEGNSNE